MFMRIGKQTVDLDVSDNGRAFRVIQPQGVNVKDTIQPIMRSPTFKHSIVRKCKKKG